MIRQNYIKYIDGIEEAEKLKAVLRVDDEELSIQRQSSMVRIHIFYFIIHFSETFSKYFLDFISTNCLLTVLTVTAKEFNQGLLFFNLLQSN